MNKNATLHTHKTAKRDRLEGAPGHMAGRVLDHVPKQEKIEVKAPPIETASKQVPRGTDKASTLAENLIQNLEASSRAKKLVKSAHESLDKVTARAKTPSRAKKLASKGRTAKRATSAAKVKKAAGAKAKTGRQVSKPKARVRSGKSENV